MYKYFLVTLVVCTQLITAMGNDPAPRKSFDEKKQGISTEQAQRWMATLEAIVKQGTENLSAQQRAMITDTLNAAWQTQTVVKNILPLIVKNNPKAQTIKFDLLKTAIDARDTKMVEALLKHLVIIGNPYIDIAHNSLLTFIEKTNKEDDDYLKNFNEQTKILGLLQKSQDRYYKNL